MQLMHNVVAILCVCLEYSPLSTLDSNILGDKSSNNLRLKQKMKNPKLFGFLALQTFPCTKFSTYSRPTTLSRKNLLYNNVVGDKSLSLIHI